MTSNEVEILLKTVYKGEGATKALSDLDKISASGSKLSGVLGKISKSLGGDAFGGTGGSESFRRRNPGLFASAQRQIGALMPGEAFLKQGAKSLMGLGPLFPGYKGPPPPVIPSGANAGSGGGNGGLGGRFLSNFLSRSISIPVGLLIHKAINAPLQALTKTIKGLNDAIENARKLYAGALTSGLGLQFTTKRALLSQVIGVSEKEVLQFGQAIQFLSPRLKSATEILSSTAPSLASVSYGFKILALDLQSFFALIIDDLAPGIRRATLVLSEFVHFFEQFHDTIAKAIDFTLDTLISALPGPLADIVASLKSVLSNLPDPGKAPNPVAYMQQIHASALEHMGLVVGGIGGATDFAAQTAQNTKKTADAVVQIAKSMARGPKSYQLADPFASMP